MGGIIGAATGAAGAYFGFDELVDVKVLGVDVSQRYIQLGPVKDRNFPFVLLARALYHTVAVATHSHADKNDIELKRSSIAQDWITKDQRSQLEKLHQKLRDSKVWQLQEKERYEEIVYAILKEHISSY